MTEDIIIRSNWITAFEKGEAIGSKIGWSFTQQDLFVLCCLHEANLFRNEIEDLLEDCNFHAECGMLVTGNYLDCRRFIAKNF